MPTTTNNTINVIWNTNQESIYVNAVDRMRFAMDTPVVKSVKPNGMKSYEV